MIHKIKPAGVIGIVISLSFLFMLTGCSTISKWVSFFGEPDKSYDNGQLTQKEIDSFAASIKPVLGDAKYHYDLARNFQKKNRHEIAVDELYKVLKIDPQFYNAYNALGVSYDNLRKYDLAVDAYQAALKIKPDLDYVYNNMGYSCLLKGDVESAVIHFQKAVALNSGHETYQNNLKLARAKLGDTEFVADVPVSKPDTKPSSDAVLAENIEKEDEAQVRETPLVEPEKKVPVEVAAKPGKPQVQLFYAVQLGAYGDLNKAVRMLNAAQKGGYDCPYIVKVVREEPYTPYFRVRAGKFKGYTDADSFAVDIADSLSEKPLVVSETYPLNVYHAHSDTVCTDVVVEHHQEPLIKNSIEILNGNGVNKMARRVSLYFKNSGLVTLAPANAGHFGYQKTKIYYAPGYYDEAVKIVRQLPGIEATALAESKELNTKFRIILGKDIVPFNRDLRKQLNI